MFPTFQNFHDSFKINGTHFDETSLFDLAYSYVKEGLEHEKEIGQFILDWIDNSETIQLTTSGTTGTPKLISISKQAMVHSALATADFFNLRPSDKALLCLPARYIAGKMMLVRAFVIGLELDIISPTSTLDHLKSNKIYDFVALVPLQAQQSFEKLSQFKKIIIGGAPVSILLSKQLQNLTSEIYETYGMTETITHIAAKRIGNDSFNVLPNVTIDIDNRNCLVLNVPFISEHKIITNDIVEITSSSSFKWIGRYDNIINSGGVKLFPEQIEAKLSLHLNQPFFIAGATDEALGQKVILVIEGAPFEIKDTLFIGLKKYEQPKAIYFIPKFIRTNTDKINVKQNLALIGL